MNESWLPIPGHSGYEVSDLGRVRSVDRVVQTVRGPWRYKGKLLDYKPSAMRRDQADRSDHGGYVMVRFRYKGPLQYVHRLVLEAFVGPCPESMEGCHNNGDKSDNRLENLRWDTRSSNSFDAMKHGTHVALVRDKYRSERPATKGGQ